MANVARSLCDCRPALAVRGERHLRLRRARRCEAPRLLLAQVHDARARQVHAVCLGLPCATPWQKGSEPLPCGRQALQRDPRPGEALQLRWQNCQAQGHRCQHEPRAWPCERPVLCGQLRFVHHRSHLRAPRAVARALAAATADQDRGACERHAHRCVARPHLLLHSHARPDRRLRRTECKRGEDPEALAERGADPGRPRVRSDPLNRRDLLDARTGREVLPRRVAMDHLRPRAQAAARTIQ